MTKQEIIADESKFQRVCGLWVSRNIGECVSSLMSDVGQNLEQCSRIFDFDYDEALGWFQSEDYEYVVDSLIDDADLDDLETIADMVGDWEDAIADVPTAVQTEDDPDEEVWVIPSLGISEDTEDDANQEALDRTIKEIRAKVKAMITSDAEYTEIGQHFNQECDYTEVYEHWTIPERWTAELLRDHGQVVFDFGGLTIWGRSTTGQSISIDGVIRRIVSNLDDDHYLWSEVQ
jgi:hypothetical protein